MGIERRTMEGPWQGPMEAHEYPGPPEGEGWELVRTWEEERTELRRWAAGRQTRRCTLWERPAPSPL